MISTTCFSSPRVDGEKAFCILQRLAALELSVHDVRDQLVVIKHASSQIEKAHQDLRKQHANIVKDLQELHAVICRTSFLPESKMPSFPESKMPSFLPESRTNLQPKGQGLARPFLKAAFMEAASLATEAQSPTPPPKAAAGHESPEQGRQAAASARPAKEQVLARSLAATDYSYLYFPILMQHLPKVNGLLSSFLPMNTLGRARAASRKFSKVFKCEQKQLPHVQVGTFGGHPLASDQLSAQARHPVTTWPAKSSTGPAECIAGGHWQPAQASRKTVKREPWLDGNVAPRLTLLDVIASAVGSDGTASSARPETWYFGTMASTLAAMLGAEQLRAASRSGRDFMRFLQQSAAAAQAQGRQGRRWESRSSYRLRSSTV